MPSRLRSRISTLRRVNDAIQPHSSMAFLPDFNSRGTTVVDPFPTASRSTATTGRHNKDRRPILPQWMPIKPKCPNKEILSTLKTAAGKHFAKFSKDGKDRGRFDRCHKFPDGDWNSLPCRFPTFSMSFASVCAYAGCDTVPLRPTSFPGSYLFLLRESTLVAAGHVPIYTNQIRTKGGILT